jgi:hypothetical protein
MLEVVALSQENSSCKDVKKTLNEKHIPKEAARIRVPETTIIQP